MDNVILVHRALPTKVSFSRSNENTNYFNRSGYNGGKSYGFNKHRPQMLGRGNKANQTGSPYKLWAMMSVNPQCRRVRLATSASTGLLVRLKVRPVIPWGGF